MKLRKAHVVATVVAMATAGAFGVATISQASAATVPASAITNDPNAANGTIAFFDSSGKRITSGSNIHHVFDYAEASTDGRPGTTKATVYFAAPDHNQPDSSNWNFNQVTASTNFPVASAPAPVNGFTSPVATAGAGDADLQSTLNFPQDTTAGYSGIIQVRLYDTGPGISQDTVFWASDIWVDPAAGTWQQVFPAVASTVNTSVAPISASPASPAAHGSSVTLTSTVTAADATHPAGSVALFDGATNVGAATFDAATGAVSKSVSPTDGAHSYKFVFTPTDTSAYNGSQSTTLAYTVNAAQSTTTSLVASPNGTAEVGSAVTLTATVSPATAGTVQFKDGATNLGSPVAVSSGTASLTTTSLVVGSHALTAVFVSSDVAFNGSTSGAVNYTITPHPATTTTTTLSVSPASPQNAGTAVTLTATVSPSSAVGAVTFFDGTTQLGSPQTWNGSSVSVSTSNLAVGSHTLSAQFVPTDATTFGSSTSATLTYVVNAIATTTTLDPVMPTAVYGQNTTLTASVSPAAATGSVQFLDGAAPIGSPVAVSGGSAGYDALLSAGTHSITARFTPANGNYTASTSAAQTVTITPASTTTTLAASPATSAFGSDITVSATINATNADGTVQFTVDGTNHGAPVAVSGGVASLVLSGLSAGPHVVGASYLPGASGNYSGSTATPLSLDVSKAATVISLGTSPATHAGQGASVTLTATISPAFAGVVTFLDGAASLGTATVSGSTATLSTSSLAIGAHSLTATFAPADANNVDGSSSSAVALDIVPATTTTLTAPAGPVDFGSAVTLNATVDPAVASGSVKFLDSSVVLATVPVTAGSAAFSTSNLDSGVHSLSAEFVPADPTAYGASTSTVAGLTVKPQTTTVSVQSVPSGSVIQGNAASFTAMLTPASAAGSVVFSDAGTPLSSGITVSAGKATFTTRMLAPGEHSITAAFTPADVLKFVGSQTSDSVSLTVLPKPVLADCTDADGHVLKPGATLAPGARIVLHGKFFVPGEQVAIEFHSTTVKAGSVAASADGTVTASVTVPTSLRAGAHLATLTGANGTASYAFRVAALSVTPPSSGETTDSASGAAVPSATAAPAVANTGAAVRLPLVIAGLLTIVGALFVSVARPRHKARHGR